MASVPIGNNSSPAPSIPTAQQPAPVPAVVGTEQPQGPLPPRETLPLSQPPAISPDQILDYAPRKARIVRVDANVVAYFGDMLHSLSSRLKSTVLPVGSSRLHGHHKVTK